MYLCGDADLRGKIHDTETSWGAYQAIAEHLAVLWPGLTVELRVPRANPLVVSRLEAANRMCCNARGERRFLVAPSCRQAIMDREQVRLDDNGGIDKRLAHDRTHHSDGTDYAICALFPTGHLRQAGTPQIA